MSVASESALVETKIDLYISNLYFYLCNILMLFSTILKETRICQRNYGISAVLLQKATDPIQQLFVEKVREYAQKKKSAGGKLVDVTPAVEKQMVQELEKASNQFGGGPSVDMTKFPTYKFQEPTVDPQV